MRGLEEALGQTDQGSLRKTCLTDLYRVRVIAIVLDNSERALLRARGLGTLCRQQVQELVQGGGRSV